MMMKSGNQREKKDREEIMKMMGRRWPLSCQVNWLTLVSRQLGMKWTPLHDTLNTLTS